MQAGRSHDRGGPLRRSGLPERITKDGWDDQLAELAVDRVCVIAAAPV